MSFVDERPKVGLSDLIAFFGQLQRALRELASPEGTWTENTFRTALGRSLEGFERQCSFETTGALSRALANLLSFPLVNHREFPWDKGTPKHTAESKAPIDDEIAKFADAHGLLPTAEQSLRNMVNHIVQKALASKAVSSDP